MGKARRNAHLSAVPSVIREAFLDHLKKSTGKEVVHSEEYVPSASATPSTPSADTARASGRRQSTKAAKEKKPHEVVYEHIVSHWMANPVDKASDIYNALGEKTLPVFLEDGSAEDAIALIDNYWQNGGSNEPLVIEAVEDQQIAMDTTEE
jgi:hypothetical protein